VAGRAEEIHSIADLSPFRHVGGNGPSFARDQEERRTQTSALRFRQRGIPGSVSDRPSFQLKTHRRSNRFRCAM